MKKTALIIGAGPAGITAAYMLIKNSNILPIILESTNEVGGISKTVEHNGNRIDIGGHRFFTKNEDVKKLWLEIMPLQSSPSIDDLLLNRKIDLSKDGLDPEKEDNVMLKRRRVSRILYLHKFFDYPISLKWQTFKNMGFRRTMKAGFGYIGSSMHKRKETNLENFYINRFGKPLYQMFFEKYTEKVWGRNPKNIDASWGAQRVKGLSLWKSVGNALVKPFRRKNSKKVETSLIEEFMYPKKGPGQLYEEMLKKVIEMGGKIVFKSEVNKIVIKDNYVKEVSCTNGEKYIFDYLLSSMPLKDLAFSIGENNMPKDSYDVATHLSYRDFITVGLLLDKLKIKNETKIKTLNNLIPDTWIYVQEDEVKLGRIQIFNNWSPYMVKDFKNRIWIGLEYFCNENDDLWSKSEQDFINFAINELKKISFIDEDANIYDSCVIKVKKAYPGYFDSYKNIDVLIRYLNSIENLYCIGRNGQHHYNNMDHSMLSAIEAVNSILDGNKHKKEDVWKVNTEKDYHEEKNK